MVLHLKNLLIGIKSDNSLATYWHQGMAGSPRIDYTINLNTWYHAVWIFDETANTQNLFINGVLQTSNTPSFLINLQSRTNSYIGKPTWVNEDYFDGQIKSFNVWNRALSASEIAFVYDQGRNYNLYKIVAPVNNKVTLFTDIAHSIYFDNDNYQDRTGNSVVTLHGSPTIDSDGLNLVRANSQYASLDQTTLGGSMTIAVWVNITSTGTSANTSTSGYYQGVFSLGSTSSMSDNIYCTQHSANARIYMQINHGSTGQWSNPHSDHYLSYSTNEWNYMVFVLNKEDGNVKFYKNSVLNSTLTTTQFPNLMTRDHNYIGTYTSNGEVLRYLDGQIKSFNIWQRALSAAEVAHLYNQGRNFNLFGVTARRQPISDKLNYTALIKQHRQRNHLKIATFDGTSNLKLDFYSALNTSSFTHCLWVRPTDTPSGSVDLFKNSNGTWASTMKGYGILMSTSLTLAVYIYDYAVYQYYSNN